MRYKPRKKLLVDSRVQGALLVRAVLYWLLFALAILQLTLTWQIATGPNGPFWSQFDFVKLWNDHAVVAISGLLMLPVVLLDVAFISNRIVGPLVRIRHTLRKLAAGEMVQPLEFRQNDFFQGLAGELNTVAAKLNCLSSQERGLESDAESNPEPMATSGQPVEPRVPETVSS